MGIDNLIPHSHAARLARRDEKRRKILGFLRSEIWTVPEIAGMVAGVHDPRTIQSTLDGIERDQMIIREESILPNGRRVILVGISMTGQAHISHVLGKPLVDRAFERGRAGLAQVEHRCDLQRLRIQLAYAGWSGWTYPDRVPVTEKTQHNTHRADAISTMPDGVVVGLEVERTVKTTARYRSILSHHVNALARKKYSRVIYTSPTEATARAVCSLMTRIEHIVVAGRETPVTPEMLSCFRFLTYQELIKGATE
jgi:hypothetical protein